MAPAAAAAAICNCCICAVMCGSVSTVVPAAAAAPGLCIEEEVTVTHVITQYRGGGYSDTSHYTDQYNVTMITMQCHYVYCHM